MFIPVRIVILSLAVAMVGCSGKKATTDVSQDSPQIEVSDAESTDGGAASDEALVESLGTSEDASAATEAAPEVSMEESSTAATDPAPSLEAESLAASSDATPVVSNTDTTSMDSSMSMSGEEKMYTVQKSETLMMVAFKVYGDYSRWREIASMNGDQLKGSYSLKEGMNLRYKAPSQEFVWSPEGNPYLIKTGDTLSLISGSVYGTIKKWRAIWDNNRPLIKDPNRIFAGFTIYYLDQDKVAQAQ
jgi:nucleoid-associated protein YgaU